MRGWGLLGVKENYSWFLRHGEVEVHISNLVHSLLAYAILCIAQAVLVSSSRLSNYLSHETQKK